MSGPAAQRSTALLVLASAAIATAAAGGQAPALGSAPSTPCAKVSSSSTALPGMTIAVCDGFHRGRSAIRLPADSATVKYGTLMGIGFGAVGDELVDRSGTGHAVPRSAIPAALTDVAGSTLAQIVVKATLADGTVTAVTPILFVRQAAMLAPFRSLTFIGSLATLAAPAGVPSSAWVRWDTSPRLAGERLPATFTNLVTGIRDGKRCRPPAVPRSGRARGWFAERLGTKPSRTGFSWVPAMHGPGDSELVVALPGGPTYMAPAPRVAGLLAGNVNPAKRWTFTIHGNPVGSVVSFSGRFAGASLPIAC